MKSITKGGVLFKIKYERMRDSKLTISRSNQIVLVLSGKGDVKFKELEIEVDEGTIFYIPKLISYQVKPASQLDYIKLCMPTSCDSQASKLNNYHIDINTNSNHKRIAKFLSYYQKSFSTNSEQMCSELLDSLEYTNLDYKVKQVSDNRISEICEYIEKNFTARISVTDISKNIGLTPAYLTTLFKNEVGISVVKYINNIRIEHAIVEIYYTDNSITKIAYKNGLADTRTLNAAIKRKFGKSPSSIRKDMRIDMYRDNKYILVDKYIDKYYQEQILDDANQVLNVELDLDKPSGQQVNNNFNFFAIGRAFDVLDAEVQSQIRVAANELQFDYCRFHNIFGDEMNCINLNSESLYEFNFLNCIKVFDFLLSVNIKPFVELGFFPKQISNKQMKAFSGYRLNTGGEIDHQLWHKMIEKFAIVLINRYGTQEISKWRFEFFNEPDLKAFWPNSFDEYIELYNDTYKIMKSISGSFIVGGFGVSNFSRLNETAVKIATLIETGKVKIDFLSVHSYPFETLEFIDYRKLLLNTGIELVYANDKLEKDVNNIGHYIANNNIPEVFITEWNTTVHHREKLNDDLFKAAALTREYISVVDKKVNGICYWTLSDIVYELGLNPNEFHGGMGIMTNSGIKKSGYHSFSLTNRVKGKIIDKSSKHLITSYKGVYYILIHNNALLKRDYGNKMGSDTVKEIPTAKLDFKLDLKSEFDGKCVVEITSITEKNNPLRYAEALNIEEYISEEEKQLLKAISSLNSERRVVDEIIDKHILNLEIEKNEVYLVKLKFISEK